ncbi:glycosyltransferase family 4 protein [Shivajiella indica]|uniref:Glycosyltransferase family 4 protein n=1 Tax=Shivajiella indica TaxID=872115 RepID=A0ABW5B5L7_9BACT
MTKPKILLVTPSFQTFILQDIAVLSEKYELIINTYNWKVKEFAPIYMVMQFFHILAHINQVSFVLVHFGGYWSFFPSLLGKIFRKPVYIVLHGTDCASIPELNYGSLRIPLLKWFCERSYDWASMLLPVSDSLVNSSNDFYQPGKQLPNGFLYHFPFIKTPYRVIPNGFDESFWKPDGSILKNGKTFMAVMSAEQYILKGGDMITELAKRFQDCNFFIAGMDKPNGLQIPDNLKFLGKIKPQEIKTYYQKSDYYFQLSIFEGFGCALCEAMLCGCQPIGSDVNNIPKIIGDTGILLKKRDVNLLEKNIKSIMELAKGGHMDLNPRERIIQNYSLENRKKLLFSVLPD